MSAAPEKISVLSDGAILAKACARPKEKLGLPGVCLVTDGIQQAEPEFRYPRFKEEKINGVVRGVFTGIFKGHRCKYLVPDEITNLAANLHDNSLARFVRPHRYTATLISSVEVKKATPDRQQVASAARKRHAARNPGVKHDRFAKFRARMAAENKV